MTPMLPSPFLQPAPPDEPTVAPADVTFDEACEQLEELAGLPEPRDLDIEAAFQSFERVVDGYVAAELDRRARR